MYAQYNQDFPPQSNRPRGALYITDRSMDLMAPFLHEFTYQAMAMDLLPIQDSDKVTYRTIVNEEDPGAEEKDMEISDKDKIWVENRHRHMKDTLDKLISDFQKFIADNPHFTNQDAQNAQGYDRWLATVPRNEGGLLITSYYGAKVYGDLPEAQAPGSGVSRAGQSC
jgi:syntaxin-binding protein 1